MKPKDLKPPFTWEERRPLLQEGVLYVPDYFSEHRPTLLPTLPPRVQMEYCSGNGDWIIARAQAHPEIFWIAVELRFDRVRKIWSKSRNAGLENLLIVCGEAWTFTHHYLPPGSIERAYVNFPDPWPKARHEKHRLMRPDFIEEVARVLTGTFTFVTDDAPYLEETLAYLTREPKLRPELPEPYYVTDREGYGSSYFDTLWRDKGRQIHYAEFAKA